MIFTGVVIATIAAAPVGSAQELLTHGSPPLVGVWRITFPAGVRIENGPPHARRPLERPATALHY